MRYVLVIVVLTLSLLFGCTSINQPNTKEPIQNTTMESKLNEVFTTPTTNSNNSSKNISLTSFTPQAPLEISPYVISVCGHTIDREGHYILDSDINETRGKNCITISAMNVVLDCNGHTIKGNSSFFGKGISLQNTNGVVIKNCIINDFGYASIYLIFSRNNIITGNTIEKNQLYGLFLDKSFDNNISGNTIINNSIGIHKEVEWVDSKTGNTYINQTTYLDIASIYLKGSSGNTLVNNNITLNNECIGLENSNDNMLIENNINSNGDKGINLYNSNSNTIINNDINLHKEWGIYLSESKNNTFINNTIGRNRHGIVFGGSSNNSFINNTVTDNQALDFNCVSNLDEINYGSGNICKINGCYTWHKCQKS